MFCFRFVSHQICCAALTLKVICIYYLARNVSCLRQVSGLSRKPMLRWVMYLFRWWEVRGVAGVNDVRC